MTPELCCYFACRLLTSNTVEEDILERAKQKMGACADRGLSSPARLTLCDLVAWHTGVERASFAVWRSLAPLHYLQHLCVLKHVCLQHIHTAQGCVSP